jgi:hypothetical protein
MGYQFIFFGFAALLIFPAIAAIFLLPKRIN